MMQFQMIPFILFYDKYFSLCPTSKYTESILACIPICNYVSLSLPFYSEQGNISKNIQTSYSVCLEKEEIKFLFSSEEIIYEEKFLFSQTLWLFGNYMLS